MKKLYLLTGIFMLAIATSIKAQNAHEDFQSFRQRMHSNYNTFRRGILDDYAQFLDNAWKEFSSFAGTKRNTVPKPDAAPVYTPSESPVAEPQPVTPTIAPQKVIPTTPPVPHAPVDTPTEPTSVPEVTIRNANITLYGLSLLIPQIDFHDVLGNVSEQNISSYWKAIHQTDTDKCINALSQYATQYHLGDYCTFTMIMRYAENILRTQSSSAQRILAQYLMLALGYDVRLALADGEVRLLLPFQQQVYGNSYFIQQDIKFYIFPNRENEKVSAHICQLPKNKDAGRKINLIINPSCILPMKPQAYSISNNHLSLSGVVNTNIIELMKNYPAMDIPCYASSNPDRQLRKEIVEQIKKQVKGMDGMQAIDALLHFVQKAFLYQTDEEQFGAGVEKAFFVEETLYYPYCDCEDRSIFFAYLVRNILGMEVHLVTYPGHACTAVALPQTPIQKDVVSYSYNGKRYYICDPTYIGANAGSCMPAYINETPKVNEW